MLQLEKKLFDYPDQEVFRDGSSAVSSGRAPPGASAVTAGSRAAPGPGVPRPLPLSLPQPEPGQGRVTSLCPLAEGEAGALPPTPGRADTLSPTHSPAPARDPAAPTPAGPGHRGRGRHPGQVRAQDARGWAPGAKPGDPRAVLSSGSRAAI